MLCLSGEVGKGGAVSTADAKRPGMGPAVQHATRGVDVS
jgi:hypothetical protein